MYLNFSSCFPCPVDENVLDFSPPEPPSKPRHRSQFAPKVRVERWCCKSGRHQTIGPPPLVCRPQPQDFLKKHSRLPPVFFDSEDLKSHPKPKPKTPPPPRPKYKPTKGGGVGEKCAFPQPPNHMGLFRAPNDPTYEATFRINKPPTHHKGFCCNCEPTPPPICTCVDCCATQNVDNFDVCDVGCPCGNPHCCFYIPADSQKQHPPQRRPKKHRKSSKVPEERDFLQENALNVVRMSCSKRPKFYVDECGAFTLDLRQDASKQGPFVLKPDYGQIPKYLEKRKEELLQEEQSGCSLLQEKRSCSKKHSRRSSGGVPGCRPMGEGERAAVMKGIRETRDKLNLEYLELLNSEKEGSKGPNSEKEGGAKTELEELESKIKDCEGDLKLLSSPKEIYVDKSTEAETGEEVLLFHS